MKIEIYKNEEGSELELLPNGELIITEYPGIPISYNLDYYDINSLIADLEKVKNTMRPANTGIIYE